MRRTALIFTLVAALAAAAAVADTEVVGTTAGGVHYKIVVPEPWNGDLVIWNHGFSLSPIGPVDDLGPLAEVHLLEGFAVAASSYRQVGWALFKSSRDLELLVQVFDSEFGAPGRVFLYGASLGGIVTAAALEQADLGNVVGALTFCGAMAGSRNWDGALDLRLLYDAVCAEVPEAALPGGPKGLPRGSTLTEEEVAEAVNACTGILERRGQRTRAQKRRLRKILRLGGLPADFLLVDMNYVTFGLSDLIHSRDKLRRRQGIGNESVVYGDPAIDAAIERVAAKPKAERRLGRNFTPDGDVGDARIISLHTSKDGLVIVENQSEYAAVVPAGNLTVGVAVERQPTHCGFTPPEVIGAWAALEEWAAGGPQPSAADLQASCEAWAAFFPGLCRIDPDFVVPDMDGRVRPR